MTLVHMSMLSFCVIFFITTTPAHGTNKSEIVKDCKEIADNIKQSLIMAAGSQKMLNIALQFWQCLNETSIMEDVYALCDIIGDLLPDPKPMHTFVQYMQQQHTEAMIDICDQTTAILEDFIMQKPKTYDMQWLSGYVQDPKVIDYLSKNGHGLVKKLASQAFINSGVCTTEQARPKERIMKALNDMLHNATQCAKCCGCQNAIIFARMKILPNRNLPRCIVDLVKTNVCPLLPVQGDLDLSMICKTMIDQVIGYVVDALNTYADGTFLCNSMLNMCNEDYSDNIVQCVCSNVHLPKSLSWIMPCGNN